MNFDQIADLVCYDEASPSGLRWLVDRRGTVRKGQQAGSMLRHPKTGRECWQVQIGGEVMLAHRVVWALHVEGALPPDAQVDHIDGNALNNVTSNLRIVTALGNMRNKGQYSSNSTGVTGVTLTKRGYYQSSCAGIDGKPVFKSFSCKRYGAEAALSLAKKWRADKLAELNSAGAGYTPRHLAH